MNLKIAIRSAALFTGLLCAPPVHAAEDYKESAAYQELRDSLNTTFNAGDSTRFFKAVTRLEDYLLKQGDLHAYYTQRCNEIVFLLNQQSVFEAYKLAMKLSKELRERKLDKELFMAINMMGHIYNYCGNRESARRCFREVLQRMEKEGYTESMPPIYMNLVQVEIDEHPDEAMRLLDEAARVATTPQRRCDIDAYRTIHCYKTGDTKGFLEGYKKYKEAEAQGMSSVHGRALETYYLASQGDIEGAVHKAKERSGAMERYGTIAEIYESAGRWKDAYQALQQRQQAADSVNSVILSNNMQGIQSELKLYEAERNEARSRIWALTAVVGFLLLLVLALGYFAVSRRRHMRQLKEARDHALESDRMKTAFINNVSHEIRTPLNIINGFTQVMANTDFEMDAAERNEIARSMQQNTILITKLVDEMLELSLNDTAQSVERLDLVSCNQLCREVISALVPSNLQNVQVRLESDIEDTYQLRTNRLLLRRIVSALLDNALKNTPEGAITIRLSARQQLTLTVEDTGCGVPPEEAEHIFERFVKLDTFKEGLGLGLSLSRSMARRMGGTLTLDTSYIGGARFVLTLPISE